MVSIIMAIIVLFSATVYLIRKEKQYIITLLPSIACTLITFGYILQVPEGLNLPSMISNIISIIATIIITVIFLKKKFKNT